MTNFATGSLRPARGLPHDPIGTVGTGDGRANLETRNTELAFFPQKPAYKWIYEAMSPCINGANAAHWKFDVSAMEYAQYSIYNPGHFYNWHIDQQSGPYKDGPLKGPPPV